MGLFDKLFSRKEKSQPEKKDSEKVIDVMLALAESLLNDGKAEQAVEQYNRILQLFPNSTAQYNLGSLYAQGKGVKQDFREGAYYFRQAEKNGDEAASKLVLKCELDYICQNSGKESYVELYERMKRFVTRVYPEDATEAHVGRELGTIGLHLINKKEYVKAGKLLRAAAEFCNDGQAQNYLGVLYNAGAGVEKNDLIALYWFDRATDNGFEAAKPDRDGLFNAYRNTLSEEEFVEYMERLARWCEAGSADIPMTPEKVDYWHSIAQEAKGADIVSTDRPTDKRSPNIEQERERMVRICMEKMVELINQNTQADGTCSPFGIRFDYPGTSNEGILHLECSKLDGTPYAFKISAIRSNTDMLISNYMKFGTLSDIVAYLSDRANLQEMVSGYQKLSESVDERW